MRSKLILLLSLGLPSFAAVTGIVQPTGITLIPLQQQQFKVPSYIPAVTWSVQPVGMGTITATGLYTAPNASGVAFIYAKPANGPLLQATVFLQGEPGSTGGMTPSGGAPGLNPPTPAVPIYGPTPSPTGPIQIDPLSPGSPVGNISVSITPGSTYLQAGQSAVFNARVQGTSDQQVKWSYSPKLGSLANGVYTAPASIASDALVTIWATSLVDTTKTATATVTLGQAVTVPTVSISIGPTSATVSAGQSAHFTASIQGSANTAISWSISPNVGSISNGTYTAPANVASHESIVVTATSAADSTKTATASVTLLANALPPVSLSLSPGSVSLTGGKSATFTPSVSGTSNTAVTWSINPQVGSINGGVYQAPSTIGSQQTVTVTATSAADSTKTASATVSLQPVGVTVGPGLVSLAAGASATFNASVSGTNNTAVTWSMNPNVGTLVNGAYTAPATVSSPQTVTIKATSVADTSKAATATVNVAANSNPSVQPSTTVTLPLEVLGANGTTVSATVSIPSGTNVSGPLSLWMQIHGLRYQTQASVQVNNSSWIPISSSTVTLLGNAAAYGGIGGGFSTLSMTMNLPAGSIGTGSNTINFRFNQTDGRVSGFRVLAFNIQTAGGSQLIPSSTFVQDDPNAWQPPSSNGSDITAGQTLWHTAALTVPLSTGGTKQILAHCSDCHAADGRDLKYFNYSNNSVETRAVFHGLTAQQGSQIASYIRNLNVVNPGRPWNPPYQPGPGLDSQPVSSWAAGAGLDAVLDNDQQMINAIFPSGIQASVFAPTSRLNQRELPLPVQLPDWNQWLPGTHPMDAFGSTFTSSGYNTIYQTLSSSLQVNNPTVYANQWQNFQAWFGAFYGFVNQMDKPMSNNPNGWTPANVDAIYSIPQWGMVKTWELNNQFQLEGMAQSIFGAQADPRAWYSNLPFFVAPHELQMPTTGVAGLRNGSAADYTYLSYIWYNLQLILNDSNGTQSYQYPIDWGYAYDFVENMGGLSSPQGGIQTMWMIKGLQVMNQLGKGPQLAGNGWQPFATQPAWLVTPEWNVKVWSGVDPSTRTAIAGGIVQSWLSEVTQFTPQQFYTGGWTTATAVPVAGGNPYDNVFPDWVWYMIPRFKFIGVDPTLVGQLAQWAQTVWPNANWTADQNATCGWAANEPANYLITCSE